MVIDMFWLVILGVLFQYNFGKSSYVDKVLNLVKFADFHFVQLLAAFWLIDALLHLPPVPYLPPRQQSILKQT